MNIPILTVRDDQGNIVEVPAIKGDKGEPGKDGTMTFADLTEEQKASLKGDKGDPGRTPVRGTDYWTEADKQTIKSYVDEAILNGAW